MEEVEVSSGIEVNGHYESNISDVQEDTVVEDVDDNERVEDAEEDEGNDGNGGNAEDWNIVEYGNNAEDGNNLNVMLSSDVLRSEIEDILKEQLSDVGRFQPLTDLLTLQQRFGNGYTCLPSFIQICDVHGADCLNYKKEEKLFRCKLASFYRLLDLFGWASNFDGNMTACFAADSDVLMTVPEGLMFSEATASCLVKIDRNGAMVDSVGSDIEVDAELYNLNFAIHAARSDVMCIAHLTCPDAYSISVMKNGLLPFGPEAAMLGNIVYFEFEDCIENVNEFGRLVNELGSLSKILVLRNYGILVCAESIEEAFSLCMNVMAAIETQMNLLAIGLENVRMPSEELRESICEHGNNPAISWAEHHKGGGAWKKGEREFEAMMRQLDAAGYCTGYVYHEPVASKAARMMSDPGQTQSYTTSYLQQSLVTDLSHVSPLRVPSSRDHRGASPNFFHHRDEPLSGRCTPNPKLARWLSDSPAPPKSVTPAPQRPESSMNQFAPRSINPVELREKIKEIRKDYYADKVTAGPQSRILEGITWDEAKVAKTATDGKAGAGDGMVISASKGIIQREHQHAVVGFKKPDPPNPFNKMSAEEEAKAFQQEPDINNSSNSHSTGPLPSSIGTADSGGRDDDVDSEGPQTDVVTKQDDEDE